MIVIIGAGPIGLYSAILLKKNGIRDVVIYDPRANEYVRPGHVSESFKIDPWLNSLLKDFEGSIHIKDIERRLYEYARSLKIVIERKKFLGFGEVSKSIIIEDAAHNKEIKHCDYLFDCTGSRREIIHAVNTLYPAESPFTITPITTTIPNKNYLLAYVKMSSQASAQLSKHEMREIIITPLEKSRSLEKLRNLGWREFAFPLCYHASFGKNKVCIYMEAPETLTEENKEQWLKAVLQSVTNSEISYELLPASRKYISKPRLNLFKVEPKEINNLTYHGHNLPIIVTAGDAQIDPHFYLAHGIADGFKRVQEFCESIVVLDGKVAYFNAEELSTALKPNLKRHKQRILNYYEKRTKYFEDAKEKAIALYEEACEKAISAEEKKLFQQRKKEVQILLGDETELSSSESKEKGNSLFAQGKFARALNIYSQALKSCKIEGNKKDIATIYSNLIITSRKLRQTQATLSFAENALTEVPEMDLKLKKKILFNTITGINEWIKRTKPEKTSDFLDKALKFYSKHQTFIEKHLQIKIEEVKSDKLDEAINSYIEKLLDFSSF